MIHDVRSGVMGNDFGINRYSERPGTPFDMTPTSQAHTEETMTRALEFHRARDFAQAGALYRQILAGNPNHADALRLLGVIARQEGRYDEAIDLIRRSIFINDAKAESHHNLGDALRSAGKLDEAIAAYRHAIGLNPDWPEAHGALGNVLRDQGKSAAAAEAYAKAVKLSPNSAAGHLNLGRALHDQGKFPQAIDAVNKAIALKPDWPEPCNSLGNIFWDQGRLNDAIAQYSKAVELSSNHAAAHQSMGKIFALQGKIEDSIACFRRAVQAEPVNAKAHSYLGHMLAESGRRAEACEAYAEAIRLKPDSPKWRFKLAALSGDSSVTTAPMQHIQDLFDDYAPRFEQHLVDQLNYRGPEQLHEAVERVTDRHDLDILDLGCGTGLCGAQFRSMARWIVGVDLSPAMIESSARRRVYDQLLQGELMIALNETARYDLILAGDVLIYVGDLTAMMPAVAKALRSGGLFAFTIEDYAGEGFFLQPQMRFAHSLNYIRSLAKASELSELSATSVMLRKQGATGANGWIIVLSKT